MAYTTINKSTDYFNTKLYTGNGSTQSITGVGFQPDFTWLKSRSGTYGAYNPQAYDAVRGAGTSKDLTPASTAVEGVDNGEFGYISAFGSDGFTLTAGSSNSNQNNGASTEYASWNWLANGAGSANTVGDIASTVSVNTTSGFSIVSYTGNNASGATVGHGLSSAPKMVIGKAINSSGEDWFVGHSSIGFDKYLKLNTTDAANTTSVIFNNTAPSNSVVTLGNNGAVNSASYNYIMYCFEDVQGFSKMGSYTGNDNADGTFVYTGFKPAFVMIKRTDTVNDWIMLDNKRNNYSLPTTQDNFNVVNSRLLANTSGAEAYTNLLDFVSNGFKMRATYGGVNSANNFIYMAFAEAPLVGTNNIPANAR